MASAVNIPVNTQFEIRDNHTRLKLRNLIIWHSLEINENITNDKWRPCEADENIYVLTLVLLFNQKR